MSSMMGVGEGSRLRNTRVFPSQCVTPPPSYEEATKMKKKKNQTSPDLPPPLPHLRLSQQIPNYSNNLRPLSRSASQLVLVSEAENDRRQPYSNIRQLYFTHYVIQNLDNLLQVIIQPVTAIQFKVTDITHRLLYTVSTNLGSICCGIEGQEVEFKAFNSQQQHVVTFTKHNGELCFDSYRHLYVKLQPDVPLGTIDTDGRLKCFVKNCSGDILCKIVAENPQECCDSLVFQVIPARRYEEWGRIEECRGGLILTFPRRSDASTRAILMAGSVLLQYEAGKARRRF